MSASAVSPDLFACVLHLDALNGATLERTQGHRAHGLFLELMRRSDHQLAAALHQSAPTKPFTVAPLQAQARTMRPGRRYSLRVSLLRQDLFAPFARAFFQPASAEVWLGDARFTVCEVLATPNARPRAGTTSGAALAEQARPVEQVTLHFITPTAFTQGSDTAGKKQIQLFPEPHAVFNSLLRRWNDLATIPIAPQLLDRVTILPARYDLHTEVLQFAKSPQLGFVGRCVYEIRGDERDRRLIHALVSAAFFLGVGYKTTQGMGLVKAEAHG